MRLCVQTMFLPRESILYMEEWLLYHSLLGFDQFRLYDNTGSKGDITSPFRIPYSGKLTKYGLPMVSEETTDEELQDAAREIGRKFDAEILPWPSRHYTSESQMEAVRDHCRRGGSDYTAFIDMDEYVCTAKGTHIGEFMEREVLGRGHCGVRMRQRKMPHILKAKIRDGSRVWELKDTFGLNTLGWSPKSILPTEGTITGPNIHELSCSGMLDQPDPETIRINHYNTNEYQMHWLSQNYREFDKETPWDRIFLGESKDDHMEFFREKMESWDYLNLEDA